MPFLLPPQEEQHRIVAKIEELFSDLDAGVAALERARVNLRRYRTAVLKAAVEGRLTAAWRASHPCVEPASKLLERILIERRKKWEADQLTRYADAGKTPPKDWQKKYVEPTPQDSGGLPELPEGWCWASVEQLGDVQLGRQRSPKNRSDRYPTKYIRAANLTEEGLDITDVLDMEFQPKELGAYRLHPGDILLSEASGSPDQVGKPIVWNGEIEDCCFQNTVIRLRPTGIPSEYPLTVFRHYYRSKMFAKVSAGVGINHLSAAKFSVLPFPLAPLVEQKEIASEVEERLSVIAVSEQQIQANLRRAARLRQSILKRAFAGKLVAQNPADEPASVLLARIRAERQERNRVENREPTAPAAKRKEPRGIIFRRGAVVSYIVRSLSDSLDFGRTQLEKVLSLTQTHLDIDLALELKRYPAGPFDEAIYKLEGFARKQGWFITSGKRNEKATYRPGPNIEERCQAAVAIMARKKPRWTAYSVSSPR